MSDRIYDNRINLVSLPNPTNAAGLMSEIRCYAMKHNITDMYQIFVESDANYIYIHQGICNPVCSMIRAELAVINRKMVQGKATDDDTARRIEILKIIEDHESESKKSG